MAQSPRDEILNKLKEHNEMIRFLVENEDGRKVLLNLLKNEDELLKFLQKKEKKRGLFKIAKHLLGLSGKSVAEKLFNMINDLVKGYTGLK